MTDRNLPETLIPYLRQSKAREGETADTSLSLDAQLTLIKEWAVRRGVRLEREIRDHDEIGDDPNRPGLAEIQERARPGMGFIVDKWDRFARDLVLQETIVRALERRGIPVISATQGNSRIERLFHGWSAEEDKRKLSERITSVRRAQANRGKYLGSNAPYGYTHESVRMAMQQDGTEAPRPAGKLIHHPDERSIVEEIYRRLDEGEALFALCADFNRRGVRPKRGASWYVQALRMVVRNPIHQGDIRWHDQVVPGIHEPIISRELWQRVNDRLDAEKIVRRHSTNDFISWCEGNVDHACGRRMYLMPIMGKLKRDGTRELYPNFFCGTQFSPDRCSIMPRAMSVRKMEATVRACLIADLSTISAVESAIAHATDAAGGNRTVADRAHLDDRRRLAERRYQRVREGWLASDEPASWLDEETARYRTDLAQIETELAALPASPEPAAYDAAATTLRSISEIVEMLPDTELGRWLGELGTAVLYAEGVSIRYKPVYRDFVRSPVMILPPRR